MTTASSPIVQVGQRGTTVFADIDELHTLNREFAQKHVVRLPQLIQPDVLKRLLPAIDSVTFLRREHPGISVELCLPAQSVPVTALSFLLNSPDLFEVVATISSREPIRIFRGRLFRMDARREHYDQWHNDTGDGRLAGLSINLSPIAYEGGALLIRQAAESGCLRVENAIFGDAVLFDISDALEHRVESVEGASPRTAFAGWFCSEPDYAQMLRRTDRLNPADHE